MGYKKYLLIYALLGLSSLMASKPFMGFLISQDTENEIIDGYEFEGDATYTFLYGSKDLFSDSFGGYLTAGGTIDWRTDEDKEKDEKKGDVDNINKYNIYNVGLTYSPMKNITLLAGVGRGQSKGIIYQKDKNSRKNRYKHFYTEKIKETNYNFGLNFSGDTFGLISMYDTFSDVYSLGFTYTYNKPKRVKKQYQKSYKSKPSNSSSSQDTLGSLFGLFAIGRAGLSVVATGMTQYNKNNPNTGANLHISIEDGRWISNTVEKFTIELNGTNNNYHHKDSSGSRLFQSGYADFRNLEAGDYNLRAYGVDTQGKEVFSLTGSIDIGGSGDKYCTIYTKSKRVVCR